MFRRREERASTFPGEHAEEQNVTEEIGKVEEGKKEKKRLRSISDSVKQGIKTVTKQIKKTLTPKQGEKKASSDHEEGSSSDSKERSFSITSSDTEEKSEKKPASSATSSTSSVSTAGSDTEEKDQMYNLIRVIATSGPVDTTEHLEGEFEQAPLKFLKDDKALTELIKIMNEEDRIKKERKKEKSFPSRTDSGSTVGRESAAEDGSQVKSFPPRTDSSSTTGGESATEDGSQVVKPAADEDLPEENEEPTPRGQSMTPRSTQPKRNSRSSMMKGSSSSRLLPLKVESKSPRNEGASRHSSMMFGSSSSVDKNQREETSHRPPSIGFTNQGS